MYLIRLLSATALLLLLGSGLTSMAQADANSASISVMIDHSDGGKRGKRHTSDLIAFLGDAGCNAVLQRESANASAQLIFDPRPVSIAARERPDHRLVARAKSLTGELKVRGAILVHASTAIEDLSSLQGERIAFVSRESWVGYRLPLALLQASGVKERWDTFIFAGNHVGALSALLHSDAYVAVMAEPLAQRWAEYNALSIVAVTDEAETGGWWAQRGLPEHQLQQCTQALGKIDRRHHKALPAWIDGFLLTR